MPEDSTTTNLTRFLQLFEETYTSFWLFRDEQKQILHLLDAEKVLLDTNIFVIKFLPNESEIHVFEAYRKAPKMDFQFVPWGYFDGEHFLTSMSSKWDRRSDLSGIHITTTALPVLYFD